MTIPCLGGMITACGWPACTQPQPACCAVAIAEPYTKESERRSRRATSHSELLAVQSFWPEWNITRLRLRRHHDARQCAAARHDARGGGQDLRRLAGDRPVLRLHW